MGTDVDKTTIPCDQKLHNCTVNASGLPVCTASIKGGEGVNCTKTEELDEYYCTNNATTGAAQCVYPPKHDCYDTKCTGKDDFSTTKIDCDQSANRCGFNETGYPLCINTTRGDGADCSKDDEFYCSVDDAGAGVCVVPPKHSCYDTKCVGKTTTIDCDQKDHRCVIDDAGEATCVNTTRGNGVDCTTTEELDEYYCQNNATTGTAKCVFPPKHNCYDTKCVGKSATIDCNQKDHRCVIDDAGEATCVNTTRGNGVDCTTTEELDEYYCQNNATTGTAKCVFPPKHNCYDTKCVGKSATIDCNQKDHRCVIDDAGEATCVNTTRGNGVDCTTTEELDEYYCQNNATTGTAECVFPPKHNCYDTKCVGKTTTIDCNQKDHRCVIDDAGEATCVNTTRGNGVDCTTTEELDEYYCQNNATTGTAKCVFPPKHNCYDTKCVGKSATIDCNQKDHRCVIDDAGEATCVNTTRGNGVDCTTTEELDEYYCQNNASTGTAECVFPPKHDCYDATCMGKDAFNTTSIPCDQNSNRCGFNETGYPVCINTTRGDGVDCAHNSTLDFYCGKTEAGASQCVFTPVKSCYVQFCQGTGDKNTSWIACDGSKNRCDVTADGSPTCIPGARGAGVNCNGTDFYCSEADGDPFSAACQVPSNYSCYNTKCGGIFDYTSTYIDCNQDTHHCSVNGTGYPLCLNTTSGAGILCSGHFSCKEDKTSGVAACEHKKSGLLPLWIVLGVIVVVLVVVVIVWVVKRRSRSDDRTSLLTAAY